MNQETVSLMCEFDTHGNKNTRVIEGKVTFLANAHPKEIIDNTLQYFCSSLAGATTGARSILGNKHRLPIAICAHTRMIWFPCKSSRKNEYIWLSLSHILHLEKINSKETRVHTSYGHIIVIPMGINEIEVQRGRAATLHSTWIDRSTGKMTLLYEPNSGIMLCKEEGDRNFTVKKKKEEKE
jgi:competence protein ComK